MGCFKLEAYRNREEHSFRGVWKKSDQEKEVANYYPFGLAFNSYQRENSNKNNYLYNGKELQDELDLGWMDYGARMYMGEIGRWVLIDPLSELTISLTPYHYTGNNPIAYFDPNGMYSISVNGEEQKGKAKRQLRRQLNSLFDQGDKNYTLPDDPSKIDSKIWEEYTPQQHTGHDKYWRNKDNGVMLAWDEEGGKGSHYHLYKDTKFKDRIDAVGNLSGAEKGMGKGAKRFHLKGGTSINLSAISRTLNRTGNVVAFMDFLSVLMKRPDNVWGASSNINIYSTQNRAYGLDNTNDPLSPMIYEFNKIGNNYEVRFYNDFYYDYDYGHWRGRGLIQKKIYVLDKVSNQLIPLSDLN